MLNCINLDSGFDSNFNIHSGIDKLGLLSSIASLVFGIFNFWNPVGWASIGLGSIGIVKSLWSFLVQTIKNPNKEKKWIRI
ncbi:hypothetical protein JP0547_08120 [Helicobacter pylori]